MKNKTIERDIYQEFTDKIIEAIEDGKTEHWVMPWHKAKNLEIPVNILSGKAYRGINILSLWIASLNNQFTSNVWGTFNQWALLKENILNTVKNQHK